MKKTVWFIISVVFAVTAASADTRPRYEAKITFSGYNRAEVLTNFPVLVELSTNITSFSYTNFVSPADGADLRFFREDNDLELNYELESWDTNGTSYVWVQIDQLTNNLPIYAMWGNTNWSTAPACRTNGAVWNAGYEAVWHLNETVIAGASTTDAYRDFTSHERDGDQVGNVNVPAPVAQGQYWDGTNDYINIPDSIVSTSSLTIATWMRPDGSDGTGVIINKNGWVTGDIHYQFPSSTTLAYHQCPDLGVSLTGFSFTTGKWHHVVTAFDRSAGSTNGVITFYVDGELKQTVTGLNTALNPSLTPGHIGNWDASRYFRGAMDEFRILNSAPSSNWIWATWMNMASNSQFNSYGSVVRHPTLVHYVSPTGGNVPPYDSWAKAATNIQDAINAATTNDTVLVTNGTYNLPATIVVTKALTLSSVNGRDVTVISGGGNKICLNLANYAVVVDGFTIRDGYTHMGEGGGVLCSGTTPLLTNCVLTANGAFHGAGSYKGTLYNCDIIGNICGYSGGGTCQSILYNCTVSGNSCVANGGGVFYGAAVNCTITSNTGGWGGGSAFANLLNCTVSDNWATVYYGGGVYYGTANNCIILDNHAVNDGGGSAFATLNNCVIAGNSAELTSGGSYYSTLNNCTVTDNSASDGGGGTSYGDVRNCIVYDNYVGASISNYTGGTYTYSCTTPLPAGTGNITNNPILLSRDHIATNSPCIGAGTNAYATGTDLDGEAWKNPPSMGCDEVYSAAMTGSLDVAISADRTYAYPSINLSFIADIEGKPTHSTWSFGDGDGATNEYMVSHAWSGVGSYPVVLTAYNTDNPGGVTATVTVQVISETTHYVSPAGGHVAPYTTWANAATSIHAAVEVACDGGSVIVTDGTYRISSEIVVEVDMTVSSVNGSSVTRVEADQSCRVFNLGAQACTLSGFTIEGGDASSGGGVYCQNTTPVISHCTISSNNAQSGAGVYKGTLTDCIIISNSASSYGGGSYESDLKNCLVKENYAMDSGGGAYYGTLVNCTVVSNEAMEASGVAYGTLTNCIVYHNIGWWEPNYLGGTFNYCCTTPMPGSGTGNTTNEPQFVDSAAGDYHLQATSPCVDAGTNEAWMAAATDLDGTPRIVNGIVDMGAYEYLALGLDITNENATVDSLVTAYTLGGTNVGVVGTMTWTNALNGSGDTFAASSPWQAVDIPLAIGENLITVSGTNQYNRTASDSVTITRFKDHGPGSPIHYVWTNSPSEAWPYTNWLTAAHTIQDAVDAATTNDIVRVTNGVYNAGGAVKPGYSLTNRVWISRPITVQSENGASNTFIVGQGPVGDGAVRCAYLAAHAVLDGFTLTNGHSRTTGHPMYDVSAGGVFLDNGGAISNCVITGCETPTDGGGVYCFAGGMLRNCILSGNAASQGGGAYCYVAGTFNECTLENNTATSQGGGARCNEGGTFNNSLLSSNSASFGGGVYFHANGTFNNSKLTDNTASLHGGGVYYYVGGTLNNCTLSGNIADSAGGVYCFAGGSTLNTIVYGNTASVSGNNYITNTGGLFTYTCTTPLPGGMGNITNDPQFVSAAAENYHLLYGSPCIDTGTNLVAITNDMDGTARPLDGNYDGTNAWDMGCYEYNPASADSNDDGVPDWWYHGYGLNPTGTTVTTDDDDSDSFDNEQEWTADTDPTNAASYFHVSAVSNNSPVSVYFDSSSNRQYYLQGSATVITGNWLQITGKTGEGGADALQDTNEPARGPFYRLGVEMP